MSLIGAVSLLLQPTQSAVHFECFTEHKQMCHRCMSEPAPIHRFEIVLIRHRLILHIGQTDMSGRWQMDLYLRYLSLNNSALSATSHHVNAQIQFLNFSEFTDDVMFKNIFNCSILVFITCILLLQEK